MVDIDLRLGDCLEILPALPDNSVDLVVTSPPYNVGIVYGNKSRDDDKKSIEEYKRFADSIMSALFGVIVAGGRMCFEIGGSGRNFPSSWIWQDAAYQAGFGLFSEIGIQHRKTNPCAWGSWMKSDNVYTIPCFHMLYVFYKETATKRNGNTTIDKREFIDWTRGYWKINYSKGKVKEHPATFPVELPLRCIKLFGHDNDVVFDPFFGSGTTGVACVQTGRNFIGIEIEEKYFNIAEKRIAEAQLQIRMEI